MTAQARYHADEFTGGTSTGRRQLHERREAHDRNAWIGHEGRAGTRARRPRRAPVAWPRRRRSPCSLCSRRSRRSDTPASAGSSSCCPPDCSRRPARSRWRSRFSSSSGFAAPRCAGPSRPRGGGCSACPGACRGRMRSRRRRSSRLSPRAWPEAATRLRTPCRSRCGPLLWVGLTFVHAVLGNVWPHVNPWTAFARLVRPVLGRRADDESGLAVLARCARRLAGGGPAARLRLVRAGVPGAERPRDPGVRRRRVLLPHGGRDGAVRRRGVDPARRDFLSILSNSELDCAVTHRAGRGPRGMGLHRPPVPA